MKNTQTIIYVRRCAFILIALLLSTLFLTSCSKETVSKYEQLKSEKLYSQSQWEKTIDEMLNILENDTTLTLYETYEFKGDIDKIESNTIMKKVKNKGTYIKEESSYKGQTNGTESSETYYDEIKNKKYVLNYEGKWVALDYTVPFKGNYLKSSLNLLKDCWNNENLENSFYFYETATSSEYCYDVKEGDTWFMYRIKIIEGTVRGLKIIQEYYGSERYTRTYVYVFEDIENTKFDFPTVK